MARRSPRAFRRRSRAMRVSSRSISGPRPRRCQRSRRPRRPRAPDRDRRVTSTAPMLELKSIRAGYGSFQALFDVSLEVRQGEAVGVIGPNGAGKTTLMRVVSGLIRPTQGSIVMGGIDLAATPPHRIVELGVAHVPESRRLFARMTVEDNLKMGGFVPAARPKFRRQLDLVYELFPRLRERRRQLAGSMSGGEQQMCAIGRALMSEPKLLLLDALVNGILLGGVLALLSLGLNLVFGVIDVVWICYAELIMLGMYGMYFLYTVYHQPIWLAAAVCILGVGILGVMLHVLVIAPLLGAAPINQLLATGGVLFFLQSAATVLFGIEFKNLGLRLPVLKVAGMFVSFSRLLAFAAALIGMVLVSVGGLYLDLGWGYVFAFAFFVVMMFVRPEGLMARRS